MKGDFPVMNGAEPLKQRPAAYGPVIVLAALLLLIVIDFWLDSPEAVGWCQAEENGLTCFRNWANAAGNVFGVLAASTAAYLAFGQFKASRMQANLALVPSLEARIEMMISMTTPLHEYQVASYRLPSSDDIPPLEAVLAGDEEAFKAFAEKERMLRTLTSTMLQSFEKFAQASKQVNDITLLNASSELHEKHFPSTIRALVRLRPRCDDLIEAWKQIRDTERLIYRAGDPTKDAAVAHAAIVKNMEILDEAYEPVSEGITKLEVFQKRLMEKVQSILFS